MHAGHRVANRHGVPRITMVAAPDRGELVFTGPTTGLPILDGHLHRDLYRDGAAISEENLIHGWRQ